MNKYVKMLFYGFDRIGFPLQSKNKMLSEQFEICYAPFESDVQFKQFDWIIIPSGIFEEFEFRRGRGVFSSRVKVKVAQDLLLEKERQMFNIIHDRDKCIVFLIDEIVDSIHTDGFGMIDDVSDTDLCKRVLNHFDIAGKPVDRGLADVRSKYDEFKNYIERFGVAKTIFSSNLDEHRVKPIILATVATPISASVGFEIKHRIFFLPFHSDTKGQQVLEELTTLLVYALMNYTQKAKEYLPDWVKGIKFKEEINLEDKLSKFFSEIEKIWQRLDTLNSYKGILTSSGDLLKEKIIQIFQKFFGYKVEVIEEYREDLKILDDSGDVFVLVEVKGTNKGVKREYINQVDSHRERNSMEVSTPGLLIINNEMNVEGIEERFETIVPEEHITHAKKFNILIIRTIDLLNLLILLENKDVLSRKNIMTELIKKGGGWLKASPQDYEVVEHLIGGKA